ncbi:exported hypothetical protein [Parafrankia sp. Ea1.12]|nr:exported hypothetical protein [Parafrankia sp. Ea1.12]
MIAVMYFCRSPSVWVYLSVTLSQADNSSASSACVMRRHEFPPNPATWAILSGRSPQSCCTGTALSEPAAPTSAESAAESVAGALAEQAATESSETAAVATTARLSHLLGTMNPFVQLEGRMLERAAVRAPPGREDVHGPGIQAVPRRVRAGRAA